MDKNVREELINTCIGETKKEVLEMIDNLEIKKQQYGLGLKDRMKFYVLWKDIEKLKEYIEGEK